MVDIDEQSLENFYAPMNVVIFGLTLIFEIYVIGFKLRFKLDAAGYIILIS
jgi:hypothetical protein